MKNCFLHSCFGFLISFLPLQEACTYNHLPASNKKIILNWYSAPALQTKEDFTTGILWLFSYLGAKLPSDKFESALKFIDDKKIEVDITELGFSEQAINNFEQLIILTKQTSEYQTTGGIDAGRFFALCFNSTYHYYKITDAPKTYDDFSAKYAAFAYKTFVCDTSSISNSSRIFNYSVADLNIQKNYFVSEEGNGVFSLGTFEKNGLIEAFDYMENGQPRFVIYNQQGNLYAPSDSSSHPAGKPAKCMWCHESGMQPLYKNTSSINGFVSTTEFLQDQSNFNIKLKNFHSKTNSKINFIDAKAHTQGEYIYLCFYEPNAERLSQEWNMSIDKIKALLANIPTHNNPEFPFLKEVYYRKQIAQFATYKSIEVSDEMREATKYEPNYLK